MGTVNGHCSIGGSSSSGSMEVVCWKSCSENIDCLTYRWESFAENSCCLCSFNFNRACVLLTLIALRGARSAFCI